MIYSRKEACTTLRDAPLFSHCFYYNTMRLVLSSLCDKFFYLFHILCIIEKFNNFSILLRLENQRLSPNVIEYQNDAGHNNFRQPLLPFRSQKRRRAEKLEFGEERNQQYNANLC